MKITVCGSMRFMSVMTSLSGLLRNLGVEDVKIPEDVRPKSLHDEEFTSVLIKRRADHVENIGRSDMVIVVCEPYEGHNEPRLIHPNDVSVAWIDNAIRKSGMEDIPDFINSWLTKAPKKNLTDIYGCTLGYKIGESTSFELITALDSCVPVVIVPANDQQWVCYPHMLKVKPDNVYLCESF